MNKPMKLTDHIAGISLFQGLSPKHYDELAMIVVDQVVPRGQMIFSQGDDPTGLYVVVSGRVKIFKLSLEGKEQILHLFGAGEPIGEVAVFAGGKFPAYAEAMEESRLFFFPRPAFIDLIRKYPSVALNMLAVLSLRLRKFTSLIEDLSLKEVPGRLAAHLLYLGEGKKAVAEVELDVSKNQLASLLGTIPETLSRILARMSRDGFIEMTGQRRIRILDRKGLEELASGEKRLA
jgi:CRP/FNR family transcriptional regulator, dissimilatory nitrate respiration regulator